MAWTAWSPASDYFNARKWNKDGDSDDHGCGCGGDCDECKEKKKKCGCCPAGLVEVRDPSDDKKVIGCLTPNDAEGYYLNIAAPPSGMVKYINAGVFLGFVSVSDYLLLPH